MTSLLFWSAYSLTVWKVIDDTWNGTLRRELFALLVGVSVAAVVGTALLVAS